MAIAFATAPTGADDTIHAFLNGFVGGGFLEQMPAKARFDPHDVSISECLRMYYLRDDDLAAARPLDQARPGGWRYLLVSGGSVINDICVDSDATGKPVVVSTSIDTPLTASTVAALLAAEADPRTAAQDYEARELYCARAEYVAVLWLHGAAGDLFVPMAPTVVAGPIAHHQVYDAATFLAWLKR
ncbi:hypothetical protein CAL12_07160 [Bordetella genomosp. 8]|uniref:Uncharacterized protein n=1 Tax=Bordetella genomosp. 8 TaxID=1416806 RepID=A0A1W6YHU3_9BORD|nr:hypothetical protein [Bordetella genomosp. 8]ARP80637.1 hypothetical protein CAL12_07160 [Bordetella genomosp. 8]